MNENTSFWFYEFKKFKGDTGVEIAQEDKISVEDALLTLLQLIEPSIQKSHSDSILQQDLTHRTRFNRHFSRGCLEKLTESFKTADLASVGGFDIAAIVFELTDDLLSDNAAISGFPREIRIDAVAYRTLYPSAKMALAVLSDGAVNQIRDESSKIIDKLRNDSEKRFVHLAKILSDKTDDLISSAFTSIEEKSDQITSDLNLNSVKYIEHAKKELKASFVLETAMRLWKTKASQHTKLFYFGSAIFALSILFPVGILLENWELLTVEFAKLTPQDKPFAFGSLVLVTIPILGYAWILRLISRFTLQNMILADDASQRRVLANTFIRLVGQGDIDEKQDRAIMLNALFRPIPGAKEQDIQPPNLADFINGKN